MPRHPRETSQSGIYHITSRGSGRRILFEDDIDKHRYLTKLRDLSRKRDIKLLAWCLMDNHVHLIVECDKDSLSEMMRQLNTSYASWFNGRHAHIGAVFQGRFSSTPIESDAHLLEAVRYIHLNPKDLGISNPLAYRWSSYASYLGERSDAGLCHKERVMKAFGSVKKLAEFHDIGIDEAELVEFTPERPRLSGAEARRIAVRLFGESFSDAIAQASRSDRDASLSRLYQAGLSIRQIERLTGVGSSAIYRAKKRHSNAQGKAKKLP